MKFYFLSEEFKDIFYSDYNYSSYEIEERLVYTMMF